MLILICTGNGNLRNKIKREKKSKRRKRIDKTIAMIHGTKEVLICPKKNQVVRITNSKKIIDYDNNNVKKKKKAPTRDDKMKESDNVEGKVVSAANTNHFNNDAQHLNHMLVHEGNEDFEKKGKNNIGDKIDTTEKNCGKNSYTMSLDNIFLTKDSKVGMSNSFKDNTIYHRSLKKSISISDNVHDSVDSLGNPCYARLTEVEDERIRKSPIRFSDSDTSRICNIMKTASTD
uniref:Serine/threonine protein kinase n=1 Tax=Parastrongyloides trichosuri TaxID=131310 RepID=A0A0N4ZQQ3_PARTI